MIDTMTSVTSNGLKAFAKISAFVMLGMTVLGLSGCGSSTPTVEERLQASEEIYQIGVNAYLWQASLETLAFMPLAQADSADGVIITEWPDNPKVANERVKATVYIIDGQLRADALKVNVFRQIKQDDGWRDIPPRAGADIKLAQAILEQARILHRNNAPTAK